MKPPTKPNILIVDNDGGVVRAIATRLNCHDCVCIVARTGAQGLAVFDAGRVDLIITDLNMPVLDGIGFARKIRERSDVPIIVVTGYRKDYTGQLNHIRDVTVLEKPFLSDELVDLVELELAMSPRDAVA